MTQAEKKAVHLYVKEGKSQHEVMKEMKGQLEREKVRELLTQYTTERTERMMYVSPEEIKQQTEEIRKSWTPQQTGRRWIARSESSREKLARAASRMMQ